MTGSTLNRHIEVFFGEIGEALGPTGHLDGLGIRTKGMGAGILRAIEMIRTSKPSGSELGCMVLLRIHEGDVQIAVTTWTREKPNADVVRGPDTLFPLSTMPEIIAGFMVSRFPDMP